MINDDDEADEVRSTLAKMRAQSRALRISSDRQRSQIESINSQIQRLDEKASKLYVDLTYTQQQLESVIASVEREHDIVADHSERLRLFADESTRNRDRQSTTHPSRSFLLVLTHWLYTPTMHLIKGIYSIVSPLVYTIHSLSLFNADILYHFAESGEEENVAHAIRKDDLLSMLQNGKLDPYSSSG